MSPRPSHALIALLASVGLAPAAHATCPASEPILSELTCSSTASGQITSGESSSLGGNTASTAYTCGTPYAPLAQTKGEDVYSFTCQSSGTVTLDISGMDCDLDMYILDDSCSASGGCEAGSTAASTTTDSVSFYCSAGQTYYVVIEGYGYSVVDPRNPSYCGAGEGHYTLSFDVSAGTGCSEDCDNGTDDDLDGYADCADSDCAGDPICDFDADNDGHDDAAYGGDDCNDANASVYPGATEYCNGIDDDCDGTIDESSAVDAYTYYRDADGDSYGNPSSSTDSCTAPSGYVLDSTDCDDTRSTTHPGAAESCDGRDNDCDGSVDEGVGTTYYRDADSDGYGTSSTTTTACSAPSGYVSNSTDCNDANAAVRPGATETCNSIDDDCDGAIDEGVTSTFYRDADSDGYGTTGTTTSGCSAPSGYVSNSTDCNDGASTVHPGASETCNSVDDDCDGTVDEGVTTTYYRDADSDGYGGTSTTSSCSLPAGYVTTSTDCDDSRSSVNPGAAEVCNSIDDDCDGAIDETGGATYYRDSDGDGFGNAGVSTTTCAGASGYVSNSSDCDDTNAAVNPSATEVCDGFDNDCDGSVDETGGTTWYADTDSDGYGTSTRSQVACSQPVGYTALSTDCDDANSAINPGATEVCDSLDNDCDGSVDESGGATWYADADADGFGNASTSRVSCSTPVGYVSDGTDCDDTRSSIHPGATEYCNSLDDDCDTLVDEDAWDASLWYEDADGDTYGNPDVSAVACAAPSDYVANDDDCWDDDASVYPGAPETADGVDQSCDGTVDETTEVYDDDGDGYADVGGDCDDTTASTSPTGRETCDGTDEDCDGVVDEGTPCVDDDGDGVTENDGDCNDGDAAVHPGQAEVPENGVDDDCDGAVDAGAPDHDADGYTTDGGDCDDAVASTFPGADETENSVDDDCDGLVDEGTAASDDDGDGVSENDGDCNDADAGISPAAGETVDGVDDDCDGLVDEDSEQSDDDGDGFAEIAGDCDDADPATNPAAGETANGVDDDCDGAVDDGLGDADGDGFTTDAGDCDDGDGFSNPDAFEACDGVDNDCDGVVDNNCEDGDTKTPEPDCGCGVGPGGAGALAMFLVLGATVARRRRS